MMNRQSDNIERLFQAARQTEPDLSDQVFADAVMQRIGKPAAVSSVPAGKQKIILWLAGMLGVFLAVSLFPASEFMQLLTLFTAGVTLPVIGFITLITSALAFSAYWVVEVDGI
jgi:hypothetical protein